MKDKYNSVLIKKDHIGILVKFSFLDDKFLSSDEKRMINDMRESEFIQYAEKRGWKIQSN